MPKYRKKPVVVKAVQITKEWFTGDHPNPLHPIGVVINPIFRHVTIDTLEGMIIAHISDWIITGVKGEKYLCKSDIFDDNYELIEE